MTVDHFKENGDKLDRKPIADDFTAVIENLSNDAQLTICLNAPYGTGKSFFITNWEKQLQDHEYFTILYNAWENDFAEDAFISFVAELREAFNKNTTVPFTKDLINLGVIVKSIGLEAIKAKLNFDVRDVVEKATDEISKKTVENLYGKIDVDILNLHLLRKEAIKELKDVLIKARKKLTKKKIVIFIDELDRCRPTFAIEILEAIKHIFNISGFIFILSMDRLQLGHSVSAVYGEKLDANGYLRRFFDVELDLPGAKLKSFIGSEFIRYNSMLSPPSNQSLSVDEQELVEGLNRYAAVFNLDLRDIQHCIKYLKIVVIPILNRQSAFGNGLRLAEIYAFLASLRISHKEIYDKVGSRISTPENLLKELEDININLEKKIRQSDYDILLVQLIATMSPNVGKILAQQEENTKQLNTHNDPYRNTSLLQKRMLILGEAIETARRLESNDYYKNNIEPIISIKKILDYDTLERKNWE